MFLANIEDQLQALAVWEGLRVRRVAEPQSALNVQLSRFLKSLATERERARCTEGPHEERTASFLLSLPRAASRERLHIFTTNYDRLIEHGCDLAGLRAIDRFVGALNPMFRASRVEVDVHYNPPGIRGEPRFLEGVIRLTKLHGSLDWLFDTRDRRIYRRGVPFGAPDDHSDVPTEPWTL